MWIYLLIFIAGTLIGSFLNVVICRLPEKRSIIKSRSACPHCKAVLAPQDLVPVLSFFFLRGKCRQCHKKISWQYPLVELLTGAFFVFLAYYHNILMNWGNLLFYRDLVFVCVLIIIMATDWRYYLIFDAVTVPMMFFALIINLFIYSNSSDFWRALSSYILAGVVAAGFFYLQFALSKGKWIGGGDIRLGLLMGLILGWPKVLVALFFAYILGSIVGIILLCIKKKTMKSQLPFGVFLSMATVISLLYGDYCLNWYLNLLLP